MRRTILTVALWAVLFGYSAAAEAPLMLPGLSAVAFDQVDIFAIGPYGSSPNDFARDVEALSAPKDGLQPTFTMPMKSLKHFAYLNGMSRVETPASHLVVIAKPGEVDTLDTQKKTYKRVAGAALKLLPVSRGGYSMPLFPGSPATTSPGTIDLTFLLDGSPIEAQTIAGQVVNGYHVVLSLVSANATGSCLSVAKFANLKGTIDSFIIDRVEPPSMTTGNLAPSIVPQDLMKLPGLNPKGCAIDTMSIQMRHVANAAALAGFYLYRRIAIVPAEGSGIPISPTIVSERGNVRDLTAADAALFTVPADYTLQP